MMYSDAELMAEIRLLVRAKIEAGEPAIKSWVMHHVLRDHPHPLGAEHEFDFHDLCAWTHVGDSVRRVLNEYRIEPPDQAGEPELWVPELQRAYLVTRNGQQAAVPIELMSDDELEMKADELERMAEGCRVHARELRRYKDARRGAA